MAFRISATREAETHLEALTAREQRTLEAAILARLVDQPTTPTRAIKRLRPNPFAEFELRLGDLRVLYNVEGRKLSSWSSAARSATSWSSMARSFMSIKVIPLSLLEADPRGTLSECLDSGQALVVELPDHRLVSIQGLEPGEDDDLVDRLIGSNPSFRALIEKSKASQRRPFPFRPDA
jgi:mRNA-degrading endonuclease RelE of RelBE toxin-antitoxin system